MTDYDLFTDYDPDEPARLEEAPRQRRTRRRRGGGLFNLLSILFLLATFAAIAGMVLIALNPAASYNPLPPATALPTPTLVDIAGLLPTEEVPEDSLPQQTPPSPTVTAPTPTDLPTSTATNTPPPSPTGLTPPPDATNTQAVFPFTLQNEAVTYSRNTNPDACAWQSIAGQVIGLSGEPIIGLPIQIVSDNGDPEVVWSGTAGEFGEAGYELQVGTTPEEREYVVRLLNTTGQALSEPIVVRTLSACDRNVAIVNFVQNHAFSR